MPPAGAGSSGPLRGRARGASHGYHHAAPGARAGRLHNPLTGWSRRLRHILGDDWAPAYLFMAPLLVLLVGLIAWPILQAIWMSFHNVIGPRWGDFVGLRNYLTQLEDPLFRRTLFLTVLFTVEAVVIKFAIGLAAALALHQLRGWRFAGVLTALILAPFIVPEVVTAAIWRFLYNPTFGGPQRHPARRCYDAHRGPDRQRPGAPLDG